MTRMSLFRNSIIIVGIIAVSWQVLFIVLYLSLVFPRINSSVAEVIMNGAGVCGVIGALTCYFPLFLKHKLHWAEKHDGLPVMISFLLLFFSLGITLLVLTAHWIGSM